MKLRWHGEARVEADAAAAFYNDKQPGLAQRSSTTSKTHCTAYNVTLKPIARSGVTFASAGCLIFPTV